VVDSALLKAVLQCSSKEARSAAVRVASDLQRMIPERELFEILRTASNDPEPRVRAEAARALSFFPNEESVRMLLEIAAKPMDKWLGYVVEHAIGATESAWSPLLEQGKLADAPVEGMKAVDRYLGSSRPGLAAQRHLVTLLNPESGEVAKVRAYSALSGLAGNKDNGKAVFARVCASCHKVGDKGYAFGPELTDVGRRLTRYDLIESIVDPNAKMDKKYTGFIGEETDTTILLLLPEGKRETIAKEEIEERKVAMQSSMPENLGATIAPSEFLDVIEYLGSLK
jgi:putative heme-binding domain-containing protein